MSQVCPSSATLQRQNLVVGGTFICGLRSVAHHPVSLQFAIPLVAQLSVWDRTSSLTILRSVAGEDYVERKTGSLAARKRLHRSSVYCCPYEVTTTVDVMTIRV